MRHALLLKWRACLLNAHRTPGALNLLRLRTRLDAQAGLQALLLCVMQLTVSSVLVFTLSRYIYHLPL